jgi:hypothetical protein
MSDIPEDPDSLEFYVNQKIQVMKDALRFGAGREVTFYELQEAGVEYQHVYNTLILLQSEARINNARKKNLFDVWWDEKYIAVKVRENTKELAGTKWATAAELTSMARMENKEEYLKEYDIMIEAEHKLAFMNHLIENWKSYQFILSMLSSNVRAEVGLRRE